MGIKITVNPTKPLTLGDTLPGSVVKCGISTRPYLRVKNGYVNLEEMLFVEIGEGNTNFPITELFDVELVITRRQLSTD